MILTIEGVGRTKSDGKASLQALGVIYYDDESKTYHMRAFNDGRFLQTEIRLLEEGEGMTWGFALDESPLCESTIEANGQNSTKSLSVHNLRKN